MDGGDAKPGGVAAAAGEEEGVVEEHVKGQNGNGVSAGGGASQARGAGAAASGPGSASGSDAGGPGSEGGSGSGDAMLIDGPTLAVGTQLMCKWRDKLPHPVRIIERKRREGDPAEGGSGPYYEYYVHYIEFNRRLDEWVTLDRLDLSTVVKDTEREGEKGEKGRTRNQKRKNDEGADGHDGHEEFDAASLREHEEFTKVKNIQFIELGRYEMETWYFSPLPPEYNDCTRLYFCEFDFAFFKTKRQLQRHMKKVKMLHPPGDEIFRNQYKAKDGKDRTLCFFEVDGKKEKIYCQNLCYLAKLFLDHKTLYYDVDLFLFYILCEVDERGCHPVGYFSKEKYSEEGYNLACILMFPSHQRKGYGKLLISFSYELSKKEHKVGTPERPLSDLGAVSYYSYWTFTILNMLKRYRDDSISIKELSDMTAIKQDDIISTLQRLNMIQYQKGQHVICAAPELLDRHIREAGNFRYLVDPSKLIWTPYQLGSDFVR